jgi:predicted molibdopterin-dependent oxidoreductase YjgC
MRGPRGVDERLITWPGGRCQPARPGTPWLEAAAAAGVSIPTGCLGGSCGACEIEVNGETVRACVAVVPRGRPPGLMVSFAVDPHW